MKIKNIKNFSTINQAESFAKKNIRKGTFDWLQAGAENGFTRNKNIKDLENLKILPKVLKGIKDTKISTNIFGLKISSPLILAPMGHQTQFHSRGEVETAIAFNDQSRLAFFSTQGRMSLKDIRRKNKNAIIGWEIFPFGDKKWIEKEIKDAEKFKCFSICFCLDANVRSHRYQDREILYDARKFGKRTNPISPNPKYALNYDWSFISWVKKKTRLPIILKGLISHDDIFEAVKRGADGVWISNHGGRMFNSGISSIEVLLELSNLNKQKTKILIDGGVRKGSDIIKYLCAGADLVGIGRPPIYGLINNGNKGVKRVFEILENELITAMKNAGFKNLAEMKKNRLKF